MEQAAITFKIEGVAVPCFHSCSAVYAHPRRHRVPPPNSFRCPVEKLDSLSLTWAAGLVSIFLILKIKISKEPITKRTTFKAILHKYQRQPAGTKHPEVSKCKTFKSQSERAKQILFTSSVTITGIFTLLTLIIT